MIDCNVVVCDDRKDVVPILSTSMIVQDYANSLDVNKGTRDNYLATIKYFLNWPVSNNIHSVNRQVMLDYKRYLIATYSSASTVNQYLTGVRSLFRYLEMLGIPNVMSTIKNIKQSKNHKKLPLTKDNGEWWTKQIRNSTIEDAIALRNQALEEHKNK